MEEEAQELDLSLLLKNYLNFYLFLELSKIIIRKKFKQLLIKRIWVSRNIKVATCRCSS